MNKILRNFKRKVDLSVDKRGYIDTRWEKCHKSASTDNYLGKRKINT